MKKLLLVIALIAVINSAYAQSGNNQLGIGLDVGVPLGDFGDAFKTGFGGTAKLLYGVGTSGQLTLTSGYTVFSAKNAPSGYSATFSVIPILAGYRHNISGLYIEPQVGYGLYGSKIESPVINADESEGAFTWAAGIGYAMAQGLDIGARYQSANDDGGSTNFVGFSLRWNFSLGSGATMRK